MSECVWNRVYTLSLQETQHKQERGFLPEVDVAFSHPVDDLVSPLPPVVAVDVHFGHGCLVHDEVDSGFRSLVVEGC